MKKMVLYLVLASMLLGLLGGCQREAVSGSDVSVTTDISDISSAPSGESSADAESEEETSSEEERVESQSVSSQPVSSQTEKVVSSTVSKEESSSAESVFSEPVASEAPSVSSQAESLPTESSQVVSSANEIEEDMTPMEGNKFNCVYLLFKPECIKSEEMTQSSFFPEISEYIQEIGYYSQESEYTLQIMFSLTSLTEEDCQIIREALLQRDDLLKIQYIYYYQGYLAVESMK